MSLRCLSIISLVLVPLAPAAQTTDTPRTLWGTPDLSGYWEYNTVTPLQRPAELMGKAVLTPAEESEYMVGRYEAIRHERNLQLNADWWQPGRLSNGRTSLIIDPPDGRLPTRTAAADKRQKTNDERRRRRDAEQHDRKTTHRSA